MSTASILVVEDEPIIALDLKRRLTRMGYGVVAIANSAKTALHAVHQSHPELVLMDICLQGAAEGIEAAAQIKTDYQLPVVFVTAHADTATLERAKATYPFGYLMKPFDDDDLVTAIETALNRYRAEAAVREALEKEKELNQLKSQFVSIVSHEFRTPLSIILTSLELLEKFEQSLTLEKKAQYLRRAKSSVEAINQLIEDTLVLGAAETEKLQFQPIPLDVSTYCRELTEEFQTIAGERHTILFDEINSPPPTDIHSWIDTKLLNHILTNLLSNAIKYSPQGGRVALRVGYTATDLHLQIQDWGIGIPLSDQPRLFDLFYRGSNTQTIPGTGLGLCIVKQSVDLHGGTISFESQPEVGTTFMIWLPRGSIQEITD